MSWFIDAGLVVLVAVVVAAIYVDIRRRQARRRPVLEVSCELQRSGGDPSSGHLLVKVSNSGRAAAHNVHGSINVHKFFFGPPKEPPPGYRQKASVERRGGVRFQHDAEPDKDGFYEVQVHEDAALLPNSHTTFDVPVALSSTGQTPVGVSVVCNIVCNEGAYFLDTVEVEIPRAPRS